MATQLPPLAELVRHKHDHDNVSYRQMSDVARRAGHTISHSQLQAYATDGVRKAPSTEQLEAIAAALSLPYQRVRAAMTEQFYGYVPREMAVAPGSKISAAVPPDLSPAEEDELARMVRAWVSARRDER